MRLTNFAKFSCRKFPRLGSKQFNGWSESSVYSTLTTHLFACELKPVELQAHLVGHWGMWFRSKVPPLKP